MANTMGYAELVCIITRDTRETELIPAYRYGKLASPIKSTITFTKLVFTILRKMLQIEL